MEAVLDDPYVLIANQKVSTVKDLLPLLEKVMQSGNRLLSSPRTSRARRCRPWWSTSPWHLQVRRHQGPGLR